MMESALGLTLNGTGDSVQGKIVDLDPDQQNVSQIWGLQINLGTAPGNPKKKNAPSFSSTLVPTAFADLWGKVASAPQDSGYTAFWQGVVDVSDDVSGWVPADSRFMAECAAVQGGTVTKLVVRMNVDAFCSDHTKDNFRYGRVVGSIHPWLTGYPQFFDAGRVLLPVQPGARTSFFNAYSHVQKAGDKCSLYVDVGNSLSATSIGGPYVDSGNLYVCLLTSGASRFAKRNYTLLGEIPYRLDGWYEATAGILVASDGRPAGCFEHITDWNLFHQAISSDSTPCRAR